jgi:hypothetical protein
VRAIDPPKVKRDLEGLSIDGFGVGGFERNVMD